VRRGEVWWANLAAPFGRRPVVLLSRNKAYAILTSVVVVPVTSTVRGIPVEVPLGGEEGLSRPCAANADTLLTVPRTVLTEKIGDLPTGKLLALNDAVRFALDLP
jgi:mRNA interferase MazF